MKDLDLFKNIAPWAWLIFLCFPFFAQPGATRSTSAKSELPHVLVLTIRATANTWYHRKLLKTNVQFSGNFSDTFESTS